MPQSPLLVDAIQIEPGTVDAGGVRLIERDPSTGDLFFKSPLHPSGVTLSKLAGQASVSNVLIVGKSGSGAEYTSIQDALDAVPTGSGSSSPWVIIVYPGTYVGDIVIEKDGVAIVGVGRVQIDDSTAGGHTITVRAGDASSPQWCWLENLRIRNTNAGKACVLVDGNSSLSLGTERIRMQDCEFVAEGLGGHQILAMGTHIVEVFGGTCDDSIVATSIEVQQCNQFMLHDVRVLRNVSMAYDSSLLVGSTYSAYYTPPDPENHYKIARSDDVGDVEVNVNGAGGFTLSYCQRVGDLSVSGDREVLAVGSRVGDVDVDAGSTVKLVSTPRQSLSGLGVLSEEITRGAQSFVASSSESVVFDLPQPDAGYEVLIDSPTSSRAWVTSKTDSGFDINFSSAQTTTVRWKTTRSVT